MSHTEQTLPEGTVITLHARLCEVLLDDQSQHLVTLPPKIARRQRGQLAVGDRVQLKPSGDDLLVEAVLPRHSQLSRPDPHRPHLKHLILANVDVVVITVAAARPKLHPRLIDRYLVAIQHGQAQPLLAINKIDLLSEPQRQHLLHDTLAPYHELELPIVLCSAETGEGLESLRQHLAHTTCAFVGHSGVGKSSLANALDPSLALEVGRVRTQDGKGRHTTTTARMLFLDQDIRLIDTPGIRSFGLWDITALDLDAYFPELEPFRDQCHFANCTHSHEPRCAVKLAVDEDLISKARFDTYLRLLDSLP